MPASTCLTRFLVLLALASCERASKTRPTFDAPVPPPVESTDVVVALDLSKSMEETDLPPDRIAAAKGAVRRFIAARRHERIGVVVYAFDAKLVSELTVDTARLEQTIAGLQIGDVPELGTAIGDGLGLAVDQLTASTAKHKVVLLLADGENNVARRFDPGQAAAAAKQAGVTVYTVLVGTDTDAFRMSVDPKTLTAIATATGGTFYQASDLPSLDRAIDDVRAKVEAAMRPPPR